jgi:hypothetical protein
MPAVLKLPLWPLDGIMMTFAPAAHPAPPSTKTTPEDDDEVEPEPELDPEPPELELDAAPELELLLLDVEPVPEVDPELETYPDELEALAVASSDGPASPGPWRAACPPSTFTASPGSAAHPDTALAAVQHTLATMPIALRRATTPIVAGASGPRLAFRWNRRGGADLVEPYGTGLRD